MHPQVTGALIGAAGGLLVLGIDLAQRAATARRAADEKQRSRDEVESRIADARRAEAVAKQFSEFVQSIRAELREWQERHDLAQQKLDAERDKRRAAENLLDEATRRIALLESQLMSARCESP